MTDRLTPDVKVAMDGIRLAPEDAAHVSSLVVSHEPNSLDHFTLTLTNDYPELPFTHGSGARTFREGRTVTIDLGYVDATERIFEGQVTLVAAQFAAASVPTVRIEGHSLLHRLRGSTTTRTFQNLTDSQIATRIATANGLASRVQYTRTAHPYVIQAAQTDLEFLLERAQRIGYELRADGRTLVFAPRKRRRSRGVQARLGRSAACLTRQEDVRPARVRRGARRQGRGRRRHGPGP